MNRVVIVVPIYRKELNRCETMSLERLFSILKNNKIVFVAPKRMKSEIGNIFWGREVEYFDDVWFVNRQSYSRFCLDGDLYKRFEDFDYMLIHQLDAFIFYDKLAYFCNLNYDYFGAPHSWLSEDEISKVAKSDEGFYVGNGGLSLRNIRKCRNVIGIKKRIEERIGIEGYFDNAEDSFFTYCGLCEDIDFRIPSVSEAVFFSIQGDVDFFRLKKKLNGKIPFGTHAWTKEFCFPLVADYFRCVLGKDYYYIDIDDNIELFYEFRNTFIIHDLFRHLDLFFSEKQIKDVLYKTINRNMECIVWGFGSIGESAYKFLNRMGIRINAVFDKNADSFNTAKIKITHPNRELTMDSNVIIITPIKHRDAIKDTVKEWSADLKTFFWNDIECEIVNGLFGVVSWEEYVEIKKTIGEKAI